MRTGTMAAGAFAPALGSYVESITDLGLLARDEELGLARAAAAGDRGARDRLIRGNLRLVIRIARDFRGRGLGMEDLVAEGNLGLIRAAEDYDPGRGVKFSTYASYWVKQAIREGLMNRGGTIRVPVHVHGLLRRWAREERRLWQATGAVPGFDQVADALGLTEGQRRMVAESQRARRLGCESQLGGESLRWCGLDVAADADDRGDDDSPGPEELGRLLGVLEARERAVLERHFGLGGQRRRTLGELGGELGITREWVRKLEKRAMEKLARAHAVADTAASSRPAGEVPKGSSLLFPVDWRIQGI